LRTTTSGAAHGFGYWNSDIKLGSTSTSASITGSTTPLLCYQLWPRALLINQAVDPIEESLGQKTSSKTSDSANFSPDQVMLLIGADDRWAVEGRRGRPRREEEGSKLAFFRKPGCILLIHIKYYTYILIKTPLNKIKITFWCLQRSPVVFVARERSHHSTLKQTSSLQLEAESHLNEEASKEATYGFEATSIDT
jgi:hypothetical protein